MKFAIKSVFSKCDQIRSFPSYLLKKSVMENFIFCVVNDLEKVSYLRNELSKSFKNIYCKRDQYSI